MIVILPVGAPDARLTVLLLKYLRDIKMPQTHECLVIYDCRILESWRKQISVLSRTVFKNVEEIETPNALENESWPHGPNWMHKNAAKWIQENRPDQFWLWWEPDMTPLTPNWLSVLEQEHKDGDKQFTGDIQLPLPSDQYPVHVPGCRISPSHFYKKFATIYDKLEFAFDLAGAESIVDNTHKTKRVKHQYFEHKENSDKKKWSKNIPSFKSTDEIAEMISAGYVAHHRCKDGSLIRYARNYYKV